MFDKYRNQVGLLIRILPLIYKIEDFAIHGGTAINLFVKNMPRLSVDIDLTYLPLSNRDESILNIQKKLVVLQVEIEKSISGVRIIFKKEALKLFCSWKNSLVKIEVNGIKRGIIGKTEDWELCAKATAMFSMTSRARLVPLSVLYGGKIVAALSRQHPRDIFDYKHMEINSFDLVKEGFIFNLLSTEKPIIEILQPKPLNQEAALTNQFIGMTDQKFDYNDYEIARKDLIKTILRNLNQTDREFLISFESGQPDWRKCIAGDLRIYPAIEWKLLNINLLKTNNPSKFQTNIDKLSNFLL